MFGEIGEAGMMVRWKWHTKSRDALALCNLYRIRDYVVLVGYYKIHEMVSSKESAHAEHADLIEEIQIANMCWACVRGIKTKFYIFRFGAIIIIIIILL